jgi:hypothetical protein
LRSSAETVQDGLFVVVTWNTVFLAEHTGPFIFTLFVHAIEALVEDWLND